MRKKLLHIMMGDHNPDLKSGLDSIFDCIHFNWIPFYSNNKKLQEETVRIYREFQPDIVFMHLQCGDAILTNTAQYMTKKSLVFSWTGDVRYPLPNHYIDMGRHITSTLFTNMNDVEYCIHQGLNSDFLQVGFDKKYFSPLGRTSDIYSDILFMGGNYHTSPFPLTHLRHDMCLRLKKEFGSTFQIYGNGWNGMQNGLIQNYDEEGTAYRSCKIAINLSHFAYKRYSSDRMFRILGSGAFCLTHHFPDIEYDFKIGDELQVWENLDDLVNKCRWYLNNDSERQRIAMNGCYKARTQFTWNHFAENLKTIADKYEREQSDRCLGINDAEHHTI